MASFFKKGSGDTASDSSSPKQKQQVLLLLLLLLVGAFAYLYYFTGLIKPREQAPNPPVQNEQVKQAIPPRAAQPAAQPQTTGGGNGTAAAPSTEKAVVTGAPSAPGKAQPEAAAKPAGPSPKAPAAAPSTPQPVQNAKSPVKPESAKTAVKPDAVKPSADKEKGKPASNAASAVSAGKADVKGDKKEASAKVTGREEANGNKPAEKKMEKYSLLIKGIPSAEEASTIKNNLTRAGVKSARVHNVKRPVPMNRLFISEFTERGEAEIELQKIRKLNADAFILKDGTKFGVYAGSYFEEKRAAKEKEQLKSKGIKVTLKKTRVTIPVVEVTAGPFVTRAAAEKEAARLGKKSLSVKVVQTGK